MCNVKYRATYYMTCQSHNRNYIFSFLFDFRPKIEKNAQYTYFAETSCFSNII